MTLGRGTASFDGAAAPSRRALLAVFGGGLMLRVLLAFVVFPGHGFSIDLNLFASWAETLARVGPGQIYIAAPTANYPPAYLWVLWLLGSSAAPVGSAFGVPPAQVVLVLLKLPPVVADMGIAALLYWAGRRWFGTRAGLAAAGLYLFVPVTWYDSALWGQADAVGTLVMLAALVLLAEGWSEPAAGLAALALLVKPQDAVCLVVVIPVLVRRHLLRIGSGPIPRLGERLAAADARLAGLLRRQGPLRLVTSGACAAMALIVPTLPFDLEHWAPPSVAGLPIIGKISGLMGLMAADIGQNKVLTANAYNLWALVGPRPLAATLSQGSSGSTPDSIHVLFGLSAFDVGALLLAVAAIVVAAGLLHRDDRMTILLGFTLVAFAFYILPTRVHERYLFPVFASGALLAAATLARAAAYLGLGTLNALNLHAVLAATGAGPSSDGLGPTQAGSTSRAIAAGIRLPFASFARNDVVVALVAMGQIAAFVLLLVVWLVVIARPARDSTGVT